jgi:hypothetical protein
LFNLKLIIMDLPGDNAALQKPTPVRPLDPAWLFKFLSDSGLGDKTTKKVVTALAKYNKAVNKAGATLQKDLKSIRKSVH